MNRRLTTQFAAVMLLLGIGGCASIRSHWPFARRLEAAVSSYEHPHRPITSTAVEQPKKSGTERTAAKEKELTTPAVNAPSESPPPSVATTNVTLEVNDADHAQAQALIDDANSRLAKIDRSKLAGEDAAAFDQAHDLANAARKAMVQRDYLAASGLARKAALVTAQVVSRTSPR